VLRHSLELTKAVRDHTITLDATLATIKAEQQEMANAETKLCTESNWVGAFRFIMLGNVSGMPETFKKGLEILKGQIASEKGLGEPIITKSQSD
jgi:hypothetical protein